MKLLEKFNPPSEAGKFGAIRKYDIHTGVDLYCEPNSVVYALEDGIVIDVIDFTGKVAGSPWWNDTKVILIKGASGVIAYGEVKPLVRYNQKVKADQKIGKVLTVLKKDKGLPMTMLHIELYENNVTDVVEWKLNAKQPKGLLDPTDLLKKYGVLK